MNTSSFGGHLSCNAAGAHGEVCEAGYCNCGQSPCSVGEICIGGECGKYQKILILFSIYKIISFV